MLGELVIGYLFLGGASAGACFVLALTGLFVPADRLVVPAEGSACRRGRVRGAVRIPRIYRRLFAPTFGGAVVMLLAGMVCLAVDLGRADRIVLLLVNPALSFVAVGAYALAACLLLACALGCVWSGFTRHCGTGALRVFEVLMLVCALVVMVYTGLLLGSLHAVPLWATPWLPVLFVASSLSCGIAIVLASAQLTNSIDVFRSVLRRWLVVDVAAVVLEGVAFAAMVAVPFLVSDASGTGAAALQSAWQLLAGADAWLLWGGFVGLGLVVPLVLDTTFALWRAPVRGVAPLVLAACILTGGFVMRYCVVQAGVHPVLTTIGVM